MPGHLLRAWRMRVFGMSDCRTAGRRKPLADRPRQRCHTSMGLFQFLKARQKRQTEADSNASIVG
eukprot:6004785-Prorocentrum_lima.AAC.1